MRAYRLLLLAIALALLPFAIGRAHAQTTQSESASTSPCSSDSPTPCFTSRVTKWQHKVATKQDMKAKTGADHDLKYISIETQGRLDYSEADLFTDKSDLIVGIDVEGNTRGHTYLIINGVKRVDGRMFFAPTTTEETNWHLSRGLIVRYKHLPPENKKRLVDWLNTKPVIKKPTCVAAASVILFDHAEFKGPGTEYWFPSQLLTFLAQNHLKGSDGAIIPAEVYTINSDLNQLWMELPTLKTVPGFFFKVLFDPYTWKGAKKPN